MRPENPKNLTNHIMKIKISLIALAFALLILQGCGSESKESKELAAKELADAAKKADEASARRVLLVKARADKAEERRLAAIERAKLTPTYKDEFGNIVFIKAEIDPSYPGGDDAMNKYLRDNLKYPTDARNKGMEGTVFVDITDPKRPDVLGILPETVKTRLFRARTLLRLGWGRRARGRAAAASQCAEARLVKRTARARPQARESAPISTRS